MFLTKDKILEAVQNGDIGITDFDESFLKPASYTLTLGSPSYELDPGKFVLLETKEKVTLNRKYAGLVFTPATLARQGINVTQGSDLAEPDTDNTFVLEISNNGNEAVKFETGMRILKIAFVKL